MITDLFVPHLTCHRARDHINLLRETFNERKFCSVDLRTDLHDLVISQLWITFFCDMCNYLSTLITNKCWITWKSIFAALLPKYIQLLDKVLERCTFSITLQLSHPYDRNYVEAMMI